MRAVYIKMTAAYRLSGLSESFWLRTFLKNSAYQSLDVQSKIALRRLMRYKHFQSLSDSLQHSLN